MLELDPEDSENYDHNMPIHEAYELEELYANKNIDLKN
jgi:hypothetical protein